MKVHSNSLPIIKTIIYGYETSIKQDVEGQYSAIVWNNYTPFSPENPPFYVLHCANIRTIVQAIRLEASRE